MPKPTITDEHLQKYEDIMKTGTLNTGTPTLPTNSSPGENVAKPQQSKVASMLAALPKAKGIGNKMFIFNGRKKIIMDGGEKEVENAKTIDAKEIKKLQKEEEKKDEETLSTPPSPVTVEEDTETEKNWRKKMKKKKRRKKRPKKKRKRKKRQLKRRPKVLFLEELRFLLCGPPPGHTSWDISRY